MNMESRRKLLGILVVVALGGTLAACEGPTLARPAGGARSGTLTSAGTTGTTGTSSSSAVDTVVFTGSTAVDTASSTDTDTTQISTSGASAGSSLTFTATDGSQVVFHPITGGGGTVTVLVPGGNPIIIPWQPGDGVTITYTKDPVTGHVYWHIVIIHNGTITHYIWDPVRKLLKVFIKSTLSSATAATS
ncbi:MAG TPA: hypothetical protein VFE05_12795 [Longimicrobiaceae bacterium]|jgi:hypothetical protein|nr:hypothetical protein [Longimicrobiaceae bacterium]